MHLNSWKSLQECGNGNLDNVLTSHIIVSSVGGQASTRMQPKEPTDIAAKWGIGLDAARRTLECTTQRGLWTVLHPSLSLRFWTNDWQLRYRRPQHGVFGDTLFCCLDIHISFLQKICRKILGYFDTFISVQFHFLCMDRAKVNISNGFISRFRLGPSLTSRSNVRTYDY